MVMWRWLQNVPFADPVERRLAPLLQLAIAAVAVVLAVAFVVAILQVGLNGLPPEGVALATLFWLALGSMLLLLRRGYFKLTTWLLLALLYTTAVRRLLLADVGDADESLIVFFLSLVVAGLFVGRRGLVSVVVLTSILVFLPDQSQKLGTDTATTFVFNFVLVGFMFDLMASTLRTELNAVLVSNQELTKAYQALEASSSELFKVNERLNITLRSIGDAVITTDADARVLLINDVAQQLTGWTQDEARGQPLDTVFRIVNEHTRQTVESPAERVLREGVIVGLANHTILITKDGREIPIDDSGAPIRDKGGAITGVVLVFRDITARRQAEQREREMAAVAERQRLARELHDSVTQSMFVATSRAEIIPRLWEKDPQTAMQHLQEVIAINRGSMAEMRALLLELRPEAVVNSALTALYQQLVDAAPARAEIEGTLVVEGEPKELPPEVHVALYRIVQECVNNILKHSRATTFRIELTYATSEVRIIVTDNGQGFDVSETHAGIGLGSMRERAEGIGATLELTSESGQGTSMTLRWAYPSETASRK